MTYKQYKEEVIARLHPTLRSMGFTPCFETLVLNNSLMAEVLNLTSKERGFFMRFNLEQDFRDSCSMGCVAGSNVETVVNDICRTIQAQSEQFKDTAKPQDYLSFNVAKPQIVASLIHADANALALARKPHKKYLDLAIVFRVLLDDFSSGARSIPVTNDLMEIWGTDADELYRIAMENLPALLPLRLIDIEKELMCLNPDIVPGGISLLAITNMNGLNGAIASLYPGALKQVAKKLQSDFVLLPSSIHEMIAAPITSKEDLLNYKKIHLDCQDGQDVVRAIDKLSDQVYYYDAVHDCLHIVRD